MKTHVDSSQTYPHFRSVVQSPVTEHAFPSIKILTTNGTGDRVVVGFLVAFSVVCPLKLFSADVTGIGLGSGGNRYYVFRYTRQETTYLDTRDKKHQTKEGAIPLNIYASHKQKKTIKSQNRNKYTTELFTQT
jgi:hypothetical protein